MTTAGGSDTAWQALAAARNNAQWCASVCRAHGLDTTFRDRAWTSARRTPPLYPDAVTVDPAATAADVLPWIDTAPAGCSVKDSFAGLDLAPAGFAVLTEASWIFRPAGRRAPEPPARVRWLPVRTPAALADWESSWAGGDEPAGLFRPGLLADPAVLVVGGYADGTVIAGAALNASPARDGAPGVVGVSNLFAADDDLDGAWAGALAAAARHFPGLPAVGYEHGTDLDAARRSGFTPVGDLRIWLR